MTVVFYIHNISGRFGDISRCGLSPLQAMKTVKALADRKNALFGLPLSVIHVTTRTWKYEMQMARNFCFIARASLLALNCSDSCYKNEHPVFFPTRPTASQCTLSL